MPWRLRAFRVRAKPPLEPAETRRVTARPSSSADRSMTLLPRLATLSGVEGKGDVGELPIDPALLLAASELGLRLEIVDGLATWEAQPVYRHQKAVERIAASIARSRDAEDCSCVHVLDCYVRFPNGLKRPDIAVLCREPSEDEQDAPLTTVPEAVVEVVSKGFEAKDLELGPPFYIAQGVKDVVVFDPSTLLVLHVRADGTRRLTSPVTVALECGCELVV